jgi:hypothetical protein
MPKTLPMILQWDESFDVGSDTLTGVNDADYKPPFALTAKLNKLTIKVRDGQGRSCRLVCEHLTHRPKSAEEQRVIALLKSDPQLRTAFMNKVAGPISNKMFDCGMIP